VRHHQELPEEPAGWHHKGEAQGIPHPPAQPSQRIPSPVSRPAIEASFGNNLHHLFPLRSYSHDTFGKRTCVISIGRSVPAESYCLITADVPEK
jgi:hypothetical protein